MNIKKKFKIEFRSKESYSNATKLFGKEGWNVSMKSNEDQNDDTNSQSPSRPKTKKQYVPNTKQKEEIMKRVEATKSIVPRREYEMKRTMEKLKKKQNESHDKQEYNKIEKEIKNN